MEIKNEDYFTDKWNEQIESEDVLKKVIAKRFIGVFDMARPIKEFYCEMYFKMVEKITVYQGRLVVSLFGGSEVECEINRDNLADLDSR